MTNYSAKYKGWTPEVKPLGGKIATGESVSETATPKFIKYRDKILSLLPINSAEKAAEYRDAFFNYYGVNLNKYLSK